MNTKSFKEDNAALQKAGESVRHQRLETHTRDKSWKHTWSTRGILQQRNAQNEAGNGKPEKCHLTPTARSSPSCTSEHYDSQSLGTLCSPLESPGTPQDEAQGENRPSYVDDNKAESQLSGESGRTRRPSSKERLAAPSARIVGGSRAATREAAGDIPRPVPAPEGSPPPSPDARRKLARHSAGEDPINTAGAPRQPSPVKSGPARAVNGKVVVGGEVHGGASTGEARGGKFALNLPVGTSVQAKQAAQGGGAQQSGFVVTPRGSLVTPRDDRASVGTEGPAHCSGASSPCSTVLRAPDCSEGPPPVSGWEGLRWARGASSPASSVASLQSSTAGPSTPRSFTSSLEPPHSQNLLGLAPAHQARSPGMSTSDKALQLLGEPGLLSQCNTALHLDLDAIAAAPAPEAKRVSALLDAGKLLRGCLGQLAARRDALLAYCMRYGAELEMQQRRALQEAAQLMRERDQAVGYLSLSQERQKRLEAALQEREEEVRRLKAAVAQLELVSGDPNEVPSEQLRLEWIQDAERVMQLVQGGALPLHPSPAPDTQEATGFECASGARPGTPTSVSESRHHGLGHRPAAHAPSSPARQGRSPPSSASQSPTLCTFPGPDGSLEDDGFFNIWSWMAVLRM